MKKTIGINEVNDMKQETSYIFIKDPINNFDGVMEYIEQNFSLNYLTTLTGHYDALIEAVNIKKTHLQKLSNYFKIKYDLYTVKNHYGQQRFSNLKTIATGVCNKPIKSIDKYLQSGVGSVDIVEGEGAVNVIFHMSKGKQDSDKILNKIIKYGENEQSSYINDVLYPEVKTSISGIWNDKFDPDVSSVDLIRSIREK